MSGPAAIPRRSRRRLYALGAGLLALSLIGGFLALSGAAPDEVSAAEKLRERLPNTAVTSIDCQRIDGLCEIVSGRNLVYSDKTARYLIVGHVYDLETRADLTAARLLELQPDALIKAGPGAAAGDRPPAQAIDVAALPQASAIAWGPENGPRVIVFSDLGCPHCRALHQDLARIGARVEEYLIAFMGTAPLAARVYCAKDRAAALAAAYDGRLSPGSTPNAQCDAGAVRANEAFFARQGWQGTPVIIRADGRVLEGRMDAAALHQWLNAGEAP